jgi:D-alanine-D-alanine ligase
MRIGLTYDLRDDYDRLGFDAQQVAEFDRADTIDAIEAALHSLGHATDRIGHVGNLLERLRAGDRWDLVLNIAEGLSSTGIGREAQVPVLLDLYGIPYVFSDPLVCTLSLHKGMTKRVVRDLGLPTPDFAIVERDADIAAIELPFPLFAKPVAEGSSKGVSGASRITDPGATGAGLPRIAGAVQAAGIGRNLLARARVHGRHCRIGRARGSGRGDGGAPRARGRCGGVLVQQQRKLRGAGDLFPRQRCDQG